MVEALGIFPRDGRCFSVVSTLPYTVGYKKKVTGCNCIYTTVL